MNAPFTSRPGQDADSDLMLKCKVGGLQSALATLTVHIARHSTSALITGARWDRHLLANDIATMRETLDELEAALPAETNAEAA